MTYQPPQLRPGHVLFVFQDARHTYVASAKMGDQQANQLAVRLREGINKGEPIVFNADSRLHAIIPHKDCEDV